MDVLYSSTSGQTGNSGNNHWNYIVPTKKNRPNFWLSDEFRNRIIVHILRNRMSQFSDSPLMLAIQGRAGDGKSSQVREACSVNGIYIFPISGASLSGSHEKESVKEMFNVYEAASKFILEQKNCLACILIDDFDLSVASTFDDRRYTVNSQLLTGSLMNLADDPTRCGSKTTQRVPIIITGNNFTSLHAPLFRHGRMDFYNWHPTQKDKHQIISCIYQGFDLANDSEGLTRLVHTFPDQPISFFTALKNDLINKIILNDYLERKEINSHSIELLIQKLSAISKVDDLIEIGKVRVISQPQNYVKKTETDLLEDSKKISDCTDLQTVHSEQMLEIKANFPASVSIYSQETLYSD